MDAMDACFNNRYEALQFRFILLQTVHESRISRISKHALQNGGGLKWQMRNRYDCLTQIFAYSASRATATSRC